MSDYKCNHCTNEHKSDDMNYETMITDIELHFGEGANHCPFCGRYLRKPEFNKHEEPVIKIRDCPSAFDGETDESHRSFAQASFSRVSTSKHNENTLYGSSIRHQNVIVFRIKRSYKNSSKYSDHYNATGLPLVEIEMSQSQFAELITTMNMGEGVPVTLHAFNGEIMPNCPEWSQQEKMQNDLAQTLDKFASKISVGMDKVDKILKKKGAINMGERATIRSSFETFMSDLHSNLPFLNECMGEALDKTVTIAKGEIESFYTTAVQKAGLEAIHSGDVKIHVIDKIELEPSELGGYQFKDKEKKE